MGCIIPPIPSINFVVFCILSKNWHKWVSNKNYFADSLVFIYFSCFICDFFIVDLFLTDKRISVYFIYSYK
ncbi:hypothetical protein BHT95_16555 [Bacillus paralicheniformis]|nr:hypothetical protein BHT95_16555 [Bacillus paralicheniformis]PAD52826.1 hypothetical protein CHH98_02330 [Bacillus licheniformis]